MSSKLLAAPGEMSIRGRRISSSALIHPLPVYETSLIDRVSDIRVGRAFGDEVKVNMDALALGT